jgi:chromosome segregation ATPase
MFRIKSFEVVHWDFWERFEIPLEGQIVTIAGPNGSGKTTLLDGLRTLLALPCSGRRDYKRYLRRSGSANAWLRAVVDNRARSGGWVRPFNPAMGDEVTLLCRFSHKGGEWTRQYRVENGCVEVGNLPEDGRWLGPDQYRRRLADAGLSSAVAKVLALEQGETDKLCEYSPRQLLDLVFTVFGDKAALENFEHARGEFKQAAQDLAQQKSELTRAEAQLESLRGKANRYAEWKRLNEERLRLETEVLPCLRLQSAHQHREQAESQLSQLAQALSDNEQKQSQGQSRLQALRQQLSGLENAYLAHEQAHPALRDKHDEAKYQLRKVQDLLAEQTRLQAQAAEEGEGSGAQLADQLAKLQNQADDQRLLKRSLLEQRTDLDKQIKTLDQAESPQPPDVRELRRRLTEAGIGHSLLCEIIEVTDESWRMAVEALLKPFPYVVVLHHASQAAAAFAVGEAVKYRHFIVPERVPVSHKNNGSVLDVLRFSEAAPSWLLVLLAKVKRVESVAAGVQCGSEEWITREGYQREKRGGRYGGVAAHEQQFGEGARRAQRLALLEQRESVDKRLLRLEDDLPDLLTNIQQHQARLAGLSASAKLAERASEYQAALERLPQLTQQAETALAAFDGGIRAQQQCQKERAETRKDEESLNKELQHLHGQHQEIVSRYQQFSHSRIDSLEAVERLRASLPLSWLENLQGKVGDFADEAEAERTLRDIQRRLDTGDWEQDPLVIDKRDKVEADLQGLQKQVSEREQNLERGQLITHQARGHYLEVLRHSVKTYGSHLRYLAQLANVEVSYELPTFDNQDDTLHQAGLNVRFSFDGKGLMGLNDGEASGGQQVIKSLILLVALMMDLRPGGVGGNGFVFIDEPFAHLDVVNIDRVGRFLRATQAQYLITTPITHNVNVYQPSDITLCTFKKTGGERWASPVGVMVRA